MQPQDDRYKQRVLKSFQQQRFMTHINASIHKIEPGRCEIHLPYDQELTQQYGYFHAGIVSTIADNAAGYAAYSLMGEFSAVLTTEFKINLIAPAQGELMIGRGHVLKYGKTLTICRAEVFMLSDGDEKLCAASQTTVIELRNKSDF